MKRIVLVIFCLSLLHISFAQSAKDSISIETYVARDSIQISGKEQTPWCERVAQSRLFTMVCEGVPLVVEALIVKDEDHHFRGLRNDYIPRFKFHADDIMQFTPAAVMLGLKTAGVESRSSWGRMMVSDLFSVGIMATAVNSIKYSFRKLRPDGYGENSFPSGHTATAFLTATMLVKEYGHKSPLVGIGAYGMAAATGLMRIANNRHWFSDVMAGAGIGILSAEFGYFFADLLFKERGLLYSKANNEFFDRYDKPSFVGLYFGFNHFTSEYKIVFGQEYPTLPGCTVGIEGAYFFNPYVGVGGQLTGTNISVAEEVSEESDNYIAVSSVQGGAYFSYPLFSRLLVGAKVLGGRSSYRKAVIDDNILPSHSGFSLCSGAALTFRVHERSALRCFLDYNMFPSEMPNSNEKMNMLTFGTAFVLTP